MIQKLKVSIVTISYNQEKYISETLNSLVAQKVNFDFEVIVADDGSTDGTQKIIKRYANKYPKIIKPILREKNIGAYQNFRDALQKATGEYLAMCEGDDYWTDENKLQIQTDFLDTHPEHALCFHPVRVFFENSKEAEYIFPRTRDKKNFTLHGLLHDNFIQTNSVVYRRVDYSQLPDYVLPADWYMHVLHARNGKIGFINRVMGVYRRHDTGLWGNEKGDEFWKKNGDNYLLLHKELLGLFTTSKEREIIKESASRVFDAFIHVSERENDERFLYEAVLRFPEIAAYYVLRERKRLNEAHIVLIAHKRELVKSQKTVALKENHIQNLDIEITRLKLSKSRRAVEKAKRVLLKKTTQD